MIRLEVSAPDALLGELRARLHGATVERSGSGGPASGSLAAFLHPHEPAIERAEKCLDSGQHVLLIAGPWLSDSALGRLSAAARQTGTRFGLLNPERFVPSRRLIREQIESGRLGVPGLVRMHRWEHAAGSGGEMPGSLDLDLDIALWLMGGMPDRVYAVEAQHVDRTGASDRPIQLHLGFPGGGMALIDYAERPRALDGYQSLSVIGSSGAAYADDHHNMQLRYGSAGPPHAIRVSERATALVALVQAFVNDQDQPEAELADSGAAWTRVLAVALAARRSVASGQAVVVAP